MALTVITSELKEEGLPNLKADRRLWLTADESRVVEQESADAAFLLIGAGGDITPDTAARYGLAADEEGKIVLPAAATLVADEKPKGKKKGKSE